MAINAHRRFLDNLAEIDHLLDLYKGAENVFKIDGTAFPGGYEVALRSAWVLLVTYWEAFVEDICADALAHIVKNVPDPSNLPKDLLKKVAREIRESKNELEMWSLAGDGWRARLESRLKHLKDQRNGSFNTPKSAQTTAFVYDSIGLFDITKHWSPDSKSFEKTLDQIVQIRGQIAHRGRLAEPLSVEFLNETTELFKILVEATTGAISTHCKEVTGKPLYSTYRAIKRGASH